MDLKIDQVREHFSLLAIESRVFIIIGMAGILFSLISTAVNISLNLGVIPTLSTMVTAFISCFFIYQVYKTERYSFYGTIIIMILTLIVYPISWITTGGSTGTIPFFFVFNFIVIAVMIKNSRIVPLISLNLFMLWGLYIYEYKNNASIIRYQTELERMIDSGIFLTIICLALFFIMHWIMKEYNRKIGKLNETREELSHLSLTDTLSGLYNRRHVMDVLKSEVRANQPLSLIMIDIDHFKKINDTYGHNIGDEVIIGIAQSLKTNLRGSDVIGRIGGEEFLVVLGNGNPDIAIGVAEKLRAIVENIVWSKVEGKITISAGVYVKDTEDMVYDLLERVDVALYQAKNNGRNQVVLYEESEERREEITG